MADPKPSPLPWTFENNGFCSADGIQFCCFGLDYDEGWSPAPEDIELILTSVNGRPALLALLRECVDAVREAASAAEDCGDRSRAREWDALLAKIREVVNG